LFNSTFSSIWQREQFASKNVVGRGYVGRRDIPLIAGVLGTEPILLDAYESYPVSLAYYQEPIKPIGGQTRLNLRNEHLSYIITWLVSTKNKKTENFKTLSLPDRYSLCGCFSYMWYRKVFKARL